MGRLWLAAAGIFVILAAAAGQGGAPAGSDAAAQAAGASAGGEQSGPSQPIAFSHKEHAGTLALTCDTCHTLSKSGEAFSIAQPPACMQCHQAIATDNPGVQKLAAIASANQTIPWVHIYEVPSFVTFSHKTHLDAGNTCQECHGQVAQRDQLFKETDISMSGCLTCHRAKNAATDCDTCHTLE